MKFWESGKVHERINVGLTAIIALFTIINVIATVVYVRTVRKSTKDTSVQTDKIISAANTQASASSKNAESADSMAVSAKSQADAAKTLADRTKDIADRTLVQARLIKEANEIAKNSVEISQRPYITVGRKDGILAEVRDAEDKDGWANIVFHLQNTGRLPAKVCILVDGTAWPLMPYHFMRDGNLMLRQRGKDSTGFSRIMENACPTIGGDSVYDFLVEKRLKQEMWEQIKANRDSQIMIAVYVQSCDAFGRYTCKNALLKYLVDAKRFEEIAEEDCTPSYRYVPDIPGSMYGTNEPLAPCALPGEDEENQKAYLRHSEEWSRQQQKLKK